VLCVALLVPNPKRLLAFRLLGPLQQPGRGVHCDHHRAGASQPATNVPLTAAQIQDLPAADLTE
jgi:hypothetical protein